MIPTLDLTDRKIIYFLEQNSRIAHSALAKKLHISKEKTNYRIRRLQNNGWIRSFYSIVNASPLGYSYHKIYFKFNKVTPRIENEIIKHISKDKTCYNLRITEGTYDLTFIIIEKNLQELRNFFRDFLHLFGRHIQDRSIHTITKYHKMNLRFIYPGERGKQSIELVPKDIVTIDNLDKEILRILTKDSKTSLVEAALHLNTTPQVINYRIKKLIEKNIIVGHTLALDIQKIKRELFQLNLILQNPESTPKIIESFNNTQTLILCYELLGKYDLSLELLIPPDQFRKTMDDFKEKFDTDYLSYDLLRIQKEYVLHLFPL